MKKKKIERKNNVFDFSISVSDYLKMADEYAEKGDFNSALIFASNAYALSVDKKEPLLTLAELYYQNGDYGVALDVACEVFSIYDLTVEERKTIIEIIPTSLIKEKKVFAGLYFLSKHGIQPTNISREDISEIDDSYSADDEERESVPPLKFADEKRSEYNKETFLRACDLYNKKEFVDALRLVESMYDEEYDRADRTKLRARCLMELGEKDKSFELLKGLYERDRKNGDLLWEMLPLGPKYYPDITSLIEKFEISDNDYAMERAAIVANELELDDLALYISEKAVENSPNNTKMRITAALAEWNAGDKENAKKSLMSVLYGLRYRYPVEYIKKLRFPSRFGFEFFELPQSLVKKLSNAINKELDNFDGKLSDPDFADALVFLLTNDDCELSEGLIEVIEKSKNPELKNIVKRVCIHLCSDTNVQKWLIDSVLLDKYPYGFVTLNTEGFLLSVDLKVPKSYEKFPDFLKFEYRFAFTMLAELDGKFVTQLCDAFEAVFVDELAGIFPEDIPISHVISYALVSKYAPLILGDFTRCNDINAKVVKQYAEGLLDLLGSVETK